MQSLNVVRTGLALVALLLLGIAGRADAFAKDSLVWSKCTPCHAPDANGRIARVEDIRTTPEEWTVIVDRMRRLHGMPIRKGEMDTLLKELCRHADPRARGAAQGGVPQPLAQRADRRAARQQGRRALLHDLRALSHRRQDLLVPDDRRRTGRSCATSICTSFPTRRLPDARDALDRRKPTPCSRISLGRCRTAARGRRRPRSSTVRGPCSATSRDAARIAAKRVSSTPATPSIALEGSACVCRRDVARRSTARRRSTAATRCARARATTGLP